MRIISLIINSYRYCIESKKSEFNSFVGGMGVFSFFVGMLLTLFFLMLIDTNQFFIPFLLMYIPVIFLCILPIYIYVDFLKGVKMNDKYIAEIEYVKVLDEISDEISIIKLDDYVEMVKENPYNEEFFTILAMYDTNKKEIKKYKNERD